MALWHDSCTRYSLASSLSSLTMVTTAMAGPADPATARQEGAPHPIFVDGHVLAFKQGPTEAFRLSCRKLTLR